MGKPYRANLLIPDGLLADLAFSFELDPDTGLYRPGDNQLGIVTGGAVRALFSAAGLSVTGLISGTAVTQSNADTTTGRLLKYGDYGLGTPIALGAGDNLDSLGAGLFYFNSTAGNTPGNNYPSSAAGALLNLKRSTTNWTQFYATYVGSGNGLLFFRSYGTSGWARWNEIAHTGRFVGTVTQSSGTPTGSVFERGSNANGEYIRYADGTQTCWMGAAMSQSVAAATYAEVTWTYPAAFLSGSVPIPSVTTRSFNDAAGRENAARYLRGVSGGIGATSGVLGVFNEHASAIDARLDGLVFGRWF